MNYSYIDAVENKDVVTVWCRNMDGELLVIEHPLEDFLYCYTLDNTGTATYKDLYGRPVRKITFTDRWDMKRFCDGRSGLYESDIPPAYKVLRDEYGEAPGNAPYNVLFYDIETYFDLNDGQGYPTPENPHGYINLFQAFDQTRKEYIIIKLDECDVPEVRDAYKEYPVMTISCKNEEDLLMAISSELDYRDIDVLLGWYTKGFDLPYIMARSIMSFGSDTASRMYCRDGFRARHREFIDENGNERIEWTLRGRQHLDMMELYKKFIPGDKTSFSLSAVSTEDLGIDKVDYDGDLGELYRENPEKFVEYGIHDVRLLHMLDGKHQIVQLAMMMARMNCVTANDVTGSVKPIEHGIMKMCLSMGIVLPDKVHSEKIKFPGAIVYDAVAGRYGMSMSIDLSGLYPATMRMLGLSPETLIMQLHQEYDDYVRVMTKSDEDVTVDVIEFGEVADVITLKGWELEAIIRESGYVISGSGAIFNGELGILAQYVARGVALRSEYQKKMKGAYESGDVDAAQMYDLYQKVVKILNNSTYGVTGEVTFRLFDLRLSKAITLTARLISKFQAWKSNDLINQLSEE